MVMNINHLKHQKKINNLHQLKLYNHNNNNNNNNNKDLHKNH